MKYSLLNDDVNEFNMLKNPVDVDESKRRFLQKTATASALSVFGSASPISLMGLAHAAEANCPVNSDYKALVCIFLQGGNDFANTLPPFDFLNYDEYKKFRGKIAHDHSNLTKLNPLNLVKDKNKRLCSYSLSPNLKDKLGPLFNDGSLAILLNTGTLVKPITRQEFLSQQVPVPPHLMSHGDQTELWMSANSTPKPGSQITGWGGRLSDKYACGNLGSTGGALTSIDLSSRNPIFNFGVNSRPYGPGLGSSVLSLDSIITTKINGFRDELIYLLTNRKSNDWFYNQYYFIMKQAHNCSAEINKHLPSVKLPFEFTEMPDEEMQLSNQLQQALRFIAIAPKLGIKRQVFFAVLNGFDHHSNLKSDHDNRMKILGTSLDDFYKNLKAMGKQNNVTTFTHSEFGRNVQSNGDGADHGWGGVQFVLGGAVAGKKIYGTAPIFDTAPDNPNTADDIAPGRAMIPTTSVDQVVATLARWFGVSSDDDLDLLLPNLVKFPTTSRNLGFMK